MIDNRYSYIVIPDNLTFRTGGESRDYDMMRLQFEFCDDVEGFSGFLEKGERHFGIDRTTRFLNDIPSKWNWLVFQACYILERGYRDVLDNYARMIDSGLRIDWLKSYNATVIDVCIMRYTVNPKEVFSQVSNVGITEYLLNSEISVKNAFAYPHPSIPVVTAVQGVTGMKQPSYRVVYNKEEESLMVNLSSLEKTLEEEKHE